MLSSAESEGETKFHTHTKHNHKQGCPERKDMNAGIVSKVLVTVFQLVTPQTLIQFQGCQSVPVHCGELSSCTRTTGRDLEPDHTFRPVESGRLN
jgi:hypothetical protein